MVTYN